VKAIVLAGGLGSRLFPSTLAASKQLLPIFDKPMIYYPLSVIMLAEIREVLLISTPHDIDQYKRLLGDGSQWGISIEYCIQEKPQGLAEAFLLGEKFIGNECVCLVLGDNVFYGTGMSNLLKEAKKRVATSGGGCIFACPVADTSGFGIVDFDSAGKVLSIEEKPDNPKSNYAVPGLYFYDNTVCSIAKKVTPSSRGELEITAVNNAYLSQNNLQVVTLGRGIAWLDTGTPQGLLNAANFVEAVQSRQGLYIACIEEIAYNNGWLNREKLRELGAKLQSTEYGQYILSLGRNDT